MAVGDGSFSKPRGWAGAQSPPGTLAVGAASSRDPGMESLCLEALCESTAGDRAEKCNEQLLRG